MSITKVRYNQIAPIPEQDDTAVDLTSTQTISGAKTFTKVVNLSPSSATANTGGQISFHYNQNSNATSYIAETASGSIRLNGNLTLTGDLSLNGNLSLGKDIISPVRLNAPAYVRHSVTKGTIPSVTDTRGLWFGDNSTSIGYSANCTGMMHNELSTNGSVVTFIRALKNEANSNVSCDIRAYVDADGNAYTYAPTPSTTDVSTKIATTEYVKNRVTEIKNLGSSYVMNVDDFNNGAGYYACGSLSTDGTGNHISYTYNGTTDIGDYRFLVEGHSAAYKCILAFSPRITDGFYYGRFWNKVWGGWHKVPTMIEGEWTPVLTGRDAKGALTYSIQSGMYCKIGHLVYIYGRVKVSGITTQPVGRVGIEGFPFSSNGLFVSINIQGYGGASNSFRKATVGYWDGARSMMCIHGNSATSMGVVDHLIFSTSSVADRYIQFNSTNTSADGLGHLLFSGWYSTNA